MKNKIKALLFSSLIITLSVVACACADPSAFLA
jgi:hypothetical protein